MWSRMNLAGSLGSNRSYELIAFQPTARSWCKLKHYPGNGDAICLLPCILFEAMRYSAISRHNWAATIFDLYLISMRQIIILNIVSKAVASGACKKCQKETWNGMHIFVQVFAVQTICELDCVSSSWVQPVLNSEEQCCQASLQSSLESSRSEYTSNSQRVAAYPDDALDCKPGSSWGRSWKGGMKMRERLKD